MERSAATAQEEEEEVGVSEKKAIFYINHPSPFLQQLLRSLFNCLGFHEISPPYHHSESPKVHSENSGCVNQASYQDDDPDDVVPPSTAQEAADPPSTATDQQIITSAVNRRSRRPGLSTGPGPQTN